MRHLDLGRLAGPVLVFGGPYSNLQATEALLAQAQARGISGRHLICSGDLVAYCAEPAATVAALRGSGAIVVAGNCEIQLAAQALDCGCGFEAGTTCDLLSAGWYAHANAHVSPQDRDWMGRLPDIVTYTQASGGRVAVIHGGVTDVARFVFDVTPEAVFREEIAALEAQVGAVDAVVAGHSGLAFERQIGAHRWINAGVIGMPAHNGRQTTTFATLDGSELQFHDLAYDVPAAFAKMQQVGLTQGYHDALMSGYWPSEDVLPKVHHVPLAARTAAMA